MKTVGEQAKEFRLAKGWTATRMAKEVKTSRQNIERADLIVCAKLRALDRRQ